MSDQEMDDKEDDKKRGAAAGALGAAGGAGQAVGQPGTEHLLYPVPPQAQPGLGHTGHPAQGTAGQPGPEHIGHPAHGMGQRGPEQPGHLAHNHQQPGPEHTGHPTQGMGQPGPEQPGHLAHNHPQPGPEHTGHPAQGMGQPGPEHAGRPGASQAGTSLSAKGVLIGAAVLAAVVAAATAAFYVLRPDPPQQAAAPQSAPAAEIGTPGGRAPGGGAPAAATPDGPVLRGTYSMHTTVRSPAGTSTNDQVGKMASDCARCDVTAVGGDTLTYRWNGNGWETKTTGPICPGDTVTITPTAVVNGTVSEFSAYYATCNGTVVTTTATRTGD